MRIPIALDGKPLSTAYVSCKFSAGLQDLAPRNVTAIPRANEAPVYAGMRQDVRKFTLEFTPIEGATSLHDVGYVFMQTLALLQPDNADERTLVVELTDGPNIGLQLETKVTIGQPRYTSRNTMLVDIFAADQKWYEREWTILPQIEFAGPIAIPLLNKGAATVAPVIQIGVATGGQRASESATVGWKYRKTVTVTNNSPRDWNRVRLTFDFGDHAALVTAGKSLATGNDVRVRCDGKELYRTLTNPNTARTFIHIASTIPAGESATYEVVYGNPDATAPRTLSTRGGNYDTYAADDLYGDSGTASSGSTSTMVDASKSWTTNEWRDGFVGFLSGTGSVRYRRIVSNDGTTLTLNRVVATAPASGTKYIIWKSGIFMDGGRVTGGITSTTIQDDQHTVKWAPNSLRGARVTFIAGSGATPATMTVASNTTDTITFTTAFSINPSSSDQFTIQRYGVLNYLTQTDIVSRPHRGLWRTSHYSSNGGRTRFGDQVPGGWIPWLMVDNQDQFAQLDVTDVTAGASVSNWPYLSARRRVRSDLSMPQKGTADGVCLYEPRGLVAFDWTYQMENDNGIGAVVIMTQEPDGDTWETIASDTTTRASLSNVSSGDAAGAWSLIGDDEPVRLYTGIIPANGVTAEIASTESKNRNAEVRNYTRTIVYMSIDECGGMTDAIWAVGSEEDIYDLAVEGRLGGGRVDHEVPPYYTFLVGHDSADSRDGHYTHLGLTQKLQLNPSPTAETPLLGIYSSTDALVKHAPYAAVIERHELNLSGTDTPLVDYRMLLPPGTNMVANEDDIANWTISTNPLETTAGVTATLANESTEVWDGANSIEVEVSATPAGPWTITLEYPRIPVVPGAHYEFGFLRKLDSLAGTVSVQMKIDWEEADGIMSAAEGTTTIGTLTTSDWAPAGSGHTAHAGSALTNPTIQARLYIVISGEDSTSGSVFLDLITLGVPNLYLDEEEIGELTVDVKWKEAHHG